MRVLVTGADGFIGSVLARSLRVAGHDVLGAVFARAPGAHEVRADLTRPDDLLALPRDFDAIVHAAGRVDGSSSERQMYVVNVEGTRHLVAWARGLGVKHLLHLSTVAVYGPRVVGEARDEATPRYGLFAGLAYMRTKALAERAVETSGVPYTILRPCAVIGAGDTVLSASMVAALASAGLPLVPSASPLRRVSLLHVGGLAEVVLRMLDHGPCALPMHVADHELSLWELAEMYAQAAKLPLQFQRVSWPDELRQFSDSGRMWLVASARFGQSYRTERLRHVLGTWPVEPLEKAVNEAVSSLQGGRPCIF